MGNQGFIRATEFTGLVAQLLKKGQPVFFFNFEDCMHILNEKTESVTVAFVWQDITH